MKRLLITILIMMVVAPLAIHAQDDRQRIRHGNRLYRQQDYTNAEVEYRKAVSANGSNPQAIYNLGCALMSQQKDSAAVEQFEKAGQIEKTPLRKAKIYHNIGVICQRHQMFGEAIEAYKESLRNNPKDDETRYNLALCKRQQKNQNGGGGGNSNKNDKDKDKNGKDKKNDDKKQNSNDKQQQQQQKPKEQMSKENAEQLLNAAIQEEKNTQQRMKKAMQQPKSRRLEKNW